MLNNVDKILLYNYSTSFRYQYFLYNTKLEYIKKHHTRI